MFSRWFKRPGISVLYRKFDKCGFFEKIDKSFEKIDRSFEKLDKKFEKLDKNFLETL